MKTITILSGKGGVGKSSFSASLSVSLAENHKIVTADCDVDASNLALIFGLEEKKFKEWKFISTNKKAVFDLKKCNSCGECVKACYFQAIEWRHNKPHLKKFSCEGCGVCEMVCPTGAIKMVDVQNAKIGYAETSYGFKIISAQLLPGESGSGKLVAQVKQRAKKLVPEAEFMIVDAAAGIGCPVIASVTGSDFCLLITEPTPSSLSDVRRAWEIVNHFHIPAGVIINKFDLNKKYYQHLIKFANDNNLPILGRLPYHKIFVQALVNMVPVITIDKKIAKIFNKISTNLLELIS